MAREGARRTYKKKASAYWDHKAKRPGRKGKPYTNGNLNVADRDSWTGRHIVALVVMHKVELPDGPGVRVDRELVARIEAAISYLYERGRDGRGRVRRSREQTEPQECRPTAAAGDAGPHGAAEVDGLVDDE